MPGHKDPKGVFKRDKDGKIYIAVEEPKKEEKPVPKIEKKEEPKVEKKPKRRFR